MVIEGLEDVNITDTIKERNFCKWPHTEYGTDVNYHSQTLKKQYRYSQLYHLMKKLEKNGDLNSIEAKFPPKNVHMFSFVDQKEKLETRKDELNQFLKEVVSKNLSEESEQYLREFLDLNESPSEQQPEDDNLISEVAAEKEKLTQEAKEKMQEALDKKDEIVHQVEEFVTQDEAKQA